VRVREHEREREPLGRARRKQLARSRQEAGARRGVALVVRPATGCGKARGSLRSELAQSGRLRLDLQRGSVRRLEVVADQLVGVDPLGRCAIGNDAGDLPVKGGTTALRKGGVCLVADEHVTKAPSLLAERPGCFGLQEIPARERPQRRLDFQPD
jgi:hypothetical protein